MLQFLVTYLKILYLFSGRVLQFLFIEICFSGDIDKSNQLIFLKIFG